MRYKQKSISSDIAKQRIYILYNIAFKNALTNQNLSKLYIRHLKKLSIHHKQKIPKYIKNKICNSCGSFLIYGSNCIVRLSSEGYIVLTCNCGKEKHIFYKSG